MGESCDVHSEDDKAPPETSKKRTVKTRAQVAALEKFYNGHKYPTESMKSELAESIGLTEKQVSGWFCHRRLRDKRLQNGEAYANRRQDGSSGIIQDRGSGLKQDSCGSTKQGDDRNFDLREVESQRLTSQERSTADYIFEHGGHYTGNPGCPGDVSSGSSSSLRNMSFNCDKDPFNLAISRFQSQSMAKEMKVIKARTGPSGYLKVKGRGENAAIAAVKRQLGQHYREDGPPLGVEFDPLPPGAFESPIQGADHDSYYTKEPVLMRSPDVPTSHKNHHSVTGYGYNSKNSSYNLDVDGTRLKTGHGSDHFENHIHLKFKPKSPIANYGESCTGKSLSMDMHESSLRGMPAFYSQDGRQRVKHGIEGISRDSVSSQHYVNPYGVRVNREQPETQLQRYNDVCPKATRTARFEFKPSKLTSKGCEDNSSQDKGPSRILKKEAKIDGEGIALNDDFDSVQVKVPKSEMRAAKRFRNVLPQKHNGKASLLEDPSWRNRTNQVPRPAAEMRSSFSEDDETAETGSSVD